MGNELLDVGRVPPEAGELQEGPVGGAEAGDPEEALRLVEGLRRRLTRILGPWAFEEAPAASPGLLDALEKRVGARLPADLRALYERTEHCAALFYWSWLSVPELMDGESHLEIQRRFGNGYEPVLDTEPAETVRRVTGHPGWIPFAHDGSGNYLAVDMAPAKNGRPGQVIATGTEYAEGPGYVADSVTSLLRKQLEWLDAGEYEGQDEGYIEFTRDLRHVRHKDARTRVLDQLHDVTPVLQHLTVHSDGPIDLSPLKNAPLLKYLKIRCRGLLDLAPLRDLPIEQLHVRSTAVDLSSLNGHPTLRVLELSTEQPVELPRLCTLDRLHHLSLSGAAIPRAAEWF